MRIANAGILAKAVRRHPDAASALRAWRKTVEDAAWANITQLRFVYPSADGVTVRSGAIVTVFNIRGNRYRLLAFIVYPVQLVTIIGLLTHAEYDKGDWKK